MHVELKEKNINLLVDFDSTFVTVESIDEISKLSCKRESAEKIENNNQSNGRKDIFSRSPLK